MGEQVSGKTRLVFITHVLDVFELKTRKYQSGVGKEAIFNTESAGWYIRIGADPNSIALGMGETKPNIEKGQKVRMIIEVE